MKKIPLNSKSDKVIKLKLEDIVIKSFVSGTNPVNGNPVNGNPDNGNPRVTPNIHNLFANTVIHKVEGTAPCLGTAIVSGCTTSCPSDDSGCLTQCWNTDSATPPCNPLSCGLNQCGSYEYGKQYEEYVVNTHLVQAWFC